MKCATCGAAIKRGDGRFCSHCGTALPDRPRIAPEEWATHAERFEQAAADPQHGIALGLPAPKPPFGTTVVVPAIFLVIWIGMGIVVTTGFASSPAPGPMFLFPLGIMLFGAGAVGLGIRKGLRNARAPLERKLAVVIDERTHVSTSGTDKHRSTSTDYFVTLQFADGTRTELATHGAIAGSVTRGDIGLAIMRGDSLADYHRYRI